jgi:ribonucleotide reductase alpha subunit
MGFQDALYEMRLPYASEDAVTFADTSMEAVSYFAIQASTQLAEERGRYATYEARCGARASCRSIRSTGSLSRAASTCSRTPAARWTGTPCASG